MAKLTTRAFVALRMEELRTFFQRYYGDGYVTKLAKMLGIFEDIIREMLFLRQERGGRPGHSELLRLLNATKLEKHAHALGWRSGLNTSKVRAYRAAKDVKLVDLDQGLAFQSRAGKEEPPSPPYGALAPSPECGFSQ